MRAAGRGSSWEASGAVLGRGLRVAAARSAGGVLDVAGTAPASSRGLQGGGPDVGAGAAAGAAGAVEGKGQSM